MVPAVVFGIKWQRFTKDLLLKTFGEFSRRDDVFQKGFTEGSILILRSNECPAPTQTLPETLTEHLHSISSKLLFVSTTPEELPEGPYLLHGTTLHRAWRLYPDTKSAFALSVVPSENGGAYEYVT